jgi:hypothetical protein
VGQFCLSILGLDHSSQLVFPILSKFLFFRYHREIHICLQFKSIDPGFSMPFSKVRRLPPGPNLDESLSNNDVEMAEAEEATEPPPKRLIIAVDFGTTFSSVAYALFDEATPRETLGLTDVKCVARYPDDRPPPGETFIWRPREDVPSELWYILPKPQTQSRPGLVNPQVTGEEPMDEDDDAASDASSVLSIPRPGTEDELGREQEDVEQEPRGSDPLFWGFGVQAQLKTVDIPKDDTRRLTRFKLMLDKESKETEAIRTQITPILEKLKESKLIKRETDVISDYLEQLFKHTKKELQKIDEYNDNIPIEFVLCVPAVWPSKARRIMQAAMGAAAQRSELGSLVNGSLDNLFILSEPEAAAACVLAEDNNDIYVCYHPNLREVAEF